ncbi:MAG: Glu/Leu/Phe/Val dehydrogenase [Simkaniaceae bacterium]|nr:Glu/Leu/Phe/Val dehydrogenase [Simkaniaceae bacterium]
MSPKLEEIKIPGYEKVVKVTDESCGLQAIISIHNTVMGPALGGTRIKMYSHFEEALTDALRLSKGMTYKSAVTNSGLGGGKSVIIADPIKGKTKAMLESFGRAVEELNGQYICAEDVGCTTEDVGIISGVTKYVVGLSHEKSSGDPSPYTAWGTFRGIQSVLQKLFGSDSVHGKKVAVQGLGQVGQKILEHLYWHGADLIISDIDPVKTAKLAYKYSAKIVAPDDILKVECDVLVPCALGGILNARSIPQLKCKAIAGCANNQLLEDADAERLFARGILYAPDFVINAGGLINVLCELDTVGYRSQSSLKKVNQIYDQLLTIYNIAENNKCSSHQAAVSFADYRLKYSVGRRVEKLKFHHSV